MRVQLNKMPNPKTLGTITLQNLSGGLNLHDDPTHVAPNQSPDMLNMWYRDGMLKKRAGQVRMFDPEGSGGDGTLWFYDKLFNGLVVFVSGRYIQYFNPYTPSTVHTVEGTEIPAGGHGTFFAFDERLYYKARGIYLRLSYNNGTLTAENILWKDGAGYAISDNVYTPVIIINRNPDGSGGDMYQPENRVNPKKTVWFDVNDKDHNYYLPVHGCTVTSVQVGDDIVDTSDTSSRTFSIGGRVLKIYSEGVPDTSTVFTRLNFDVPLYVDETGWNGRDWSTTASAGGNYLTNIRYSNFSIPISSGTTIRGGKVIRRGDKTESGAAADVPWKYRASFLARALSFCPFSDKSKRFALDNGQTFNLFILSPTFKVWKYQSSNTEMWMTNYYRVSYSYVNNTWTTYDMMGKKSNGWHYANNCIYSTVNVYYGSTKIISTNTTPAAGTTNLLDSFKSLAEKQLIAIMGGSLSNYELLWISETKDKVKFYYKKNADDFGVTDYNATSGSFKCKKIILVTLVRDNLLPSSTSDYSVWYITATGDWSHSLKEIVWCKKDLVYQKYITGDNVISPMGTLSSKYRRLAETAVYRARRDYPNANIPTPANYAIAESADGKYITVYIDAGMTLTSYNVSTGEFKASGWISEAPTINQNYEAISLDITTPATLSNKLRVTYSKVNHDAMNAIADCKYATSFGGTDAVCVVMGNCIKQPNAIFWSGNGSYGVDATYFPMDQYNLCGAYQDPVTGFGKQQSVLIVFQNHHVSKATYRLDEVAGRKYIDLTLNTINSERGCDMPWSIALCGNNLVWMHSKHGVLYLRDTSAAYENMIVVASQNVNGNKARPGLLADLKKVPDYKVVGVEDGQRYYAFIGDKLYCWDYSISSVGDGLATLSWSRHDGFSVQAATEADTGTLWLMDNKGRISKLDENATTDFGSTITCHYKTPVQTFGGYGRMRTVTRIVASILNNPDGEIRIKYGGEGQNVWTSGRSYTPRITTGLKTKGGDEIVTKAYGMKMVKTIGLYRPDEPQSGEFWMPLVLKPRAIRVNNFWVEIWAEGSFALDNMTIAYTTHSLTK